MSSKYLLELAMMRRGIGQSFCGYTQPGFFTAVQVGKIAVSIQASDTHYCTPRAVLGTLGEYKSVEVMLCMENDATVPAFPAWDSRRKCEDGVMPRMSLEDCSGLIEMLELYYGVAPVFPSSSSSSSSS